MKKAFVLFWQGLTGIFLGIVNWIGVLLGMKDDSKYGKVLRRIVATSFTVTMVVIAAIAVYIAVQACVEIIPRKFVVSEDSYETHRLSGGVCYYSNFGRNGFVKNANGKKTISDIDWIALPCGKDSLVCYKTGKLRGYFNMKTGTPVIKPRYSHAWVYSDGLACVDDGGWVKFIDCAGNVVIDTQVPNDRYFGRRVFHNNLCAVPTPDLNAVGLMDRQGRWVLEAEYDNIELADSLWIVTKGDERSVMTSNLDTILPFTKASYFVDRSMITAVMTDHTIRKYTLSGELINDFYIHSVEQLIYDTMELREPVKEYDEDGNFYGVAAPDTKKAIAHCLQYEAQYDWYGLMSPTGKIITPPIYKDIEALGPDLYLCKDVSYDGTLINADGKQVR